MRPRRDQLMLSNVGEPTGSLVGRRAFRTVCLVVAAFTVPLGVVNLIDGKTFLGLVSLVFGLANLVNGVLLFRGRTGFFGELFLCYAGAAATLFAVYADVRFGVFPTYVLAVGVFLLLERRSAIILNVVFIAALAPLVVKLSGLEVAARLIPTLTMVAVLAYLFRSSLDSRASDLNQRLEELQRANAAKSDFVANMSHEMRTPLTTVKGYAESVLAECDEDDPKRESLTSIVLGARHLGNLIQDVLDLSRIENDTLEVTREKTEVSSLIAEVVQMLGNAAETKGIELTLEQKFPLPRYVWTDSTRLSQILVNLVGNAVKFTESGSVEVVVEHQRDDNTLSVAVIDTGIGIAEEFRDGLFQRFAQADATMTRRYGGAGLGLFISQRLASLLGGRIEYAPRETGSVFRLVLAMDSPVDEWITADAPAPRADPETIVDDGALEGNVLIAEDNPSNQLLLGLMLEKLGLRYATADNGREAVDKVRDESYDVVLMDLQMPVQSGVEAAGEIRSFNPSIPIVAISADVLRYKMGSDEMNSFTDMLSKPIDMQRLQSVLEGLLSSRDAIEPSRV